MISSFRYYMKKEILYIDLTVVPYCSVVVLPDLCLLVPYCMFNMARIHIKFSFVLNVHLLGKSYSSDD